MKQLQFSFRQVERLARPVGLDRLGVARFLLDPDAKKRVLGGRARSRVVELRVKKDRFAAVVAEFERMLADGLVDDLDVMRQRLHTAADLNRAVASASEDSDVEGPSSSGDESGDDPSDNESADESDAGR